MVRIYFFFLLTFFSLNFFAKSRLTIVVEKFNSSKEFSLVSETLEQVVVHELGKRKDITVLNYSEVKEILDFDKKSRAFGCSNPNECLLELNEKLKADYVFSGKVAKLGREYVFALSGINLKNPTKSKQIAIQGKDVLKLKSEVHAMVDKILGESEDKPQFQLKKGENLTLVVVPLRSSGLKKTTVEAIKQILNSQLNQIEGLNIISQDDVQVILNKSAIDSKVDCIESLKCLVELGASFGAGKLIAGTVTKMDDSFLVSLQLIDSRKAVVLNRVLEIYNGEENEIKNAIKFSAYKILGIDYKSKKGNIDLTFNIDEGKLYLKGLEKKIEKNQFLNSGMIPGKYTLKIIPDSEKYIPLQTDIYVVPEQTTYKKFSLVEKPTPWYKSWWFWTISGAVVTGAVTTTVILTQEQTPSPKGSVNGS